MNLDSLLAAAAVYTPGTVDEPAAYKKGTGSPVYPDSLLRAGVAGRVVARFAVDTAGQVEPATISLVSETDSLFGAAVRTALSGARFRPARLGGHAVRQLVEMPFEFKPPPSDSVDSVPANGSGRGGGALKR